ncbi:collagen alpha-1(XV) chain, partial [Elysia marginata]
MRGTSISDTAQFFFREPLSEEFAIVALYNAYRQNAGYLFAVVNPYETLIQFGLAVVAGDPNRGEQNVIVYYTPSNLHS